MKLKYYLRGIGIGIVITTLIFMISIAIHKDDFDDTEKNADVVTESTTVADAVGKNDTEALETENTDELPHVETEVVKSEILPENEENKEQKEEPQSQDNTSKTSEKKEEKIRFQISGGEYSDVVCQKLVDEGLVDDAQKFNKYLIEKDLDNFILPGVYEIPKDATYEEIATLLTTKVEKEE